MNAPKQSSSQLYKTRRLVSASIATLLNECFTIHSNNQTRDEVKLCVVCARKVLLALRKVLWSRSEVSLRRKLRIYRASIRPVFTCPCETWPLSRWKVFIVDASVMWQK